MTDSTIIGQPRPGLVYGDHPPHWGWLIGLGVLSTILGVIGLGMAFGLTIAGVLLFGILLLVGGGWQLVDAFRQRGWKGALLHGAIAVVYLATGFVMIVDPTGAALALTLVLGIALIVAGLIRSVICLQQRDQPGWQLALAGGVLSIVLGGIILASWPISGFWFIGVVIAVELLINGWTALFLGLVARRVQRQSGTA
jgi:uncharacterized membrane protein HdeD (DUF308 family)